MDRFWSLKTGLLWLAAAGFGGSACAGQPEVARSPDPVKVSWGDSEPEAAPDAPDAPAEAAGAEPAAAEPSRAGPIEIDLDAPAATSKGEPAPAEAAAAADEKAEGEEEEEEAEEKAAVPEPAATATADPLALELKKRRTAAKARTDAKAKATNAKGKKSNSKGKKSSKKSEPAGPSSSNYKGSDPCRAASFSVARVREACGSGGRPAAKRVMKDAIGKATATGQTLKCSDCHANQRDFTLKADAVAELKRWLDGSSS